MQQLNVNDLAFEDIEPKPFTRNQTVTVMIVDDHDVVREGMKRILESDDNIKVIGEACNGIEAVELAPKLKPAVITMDIKMPGMDGIFATREIRKVMPDAVIIVLTLYSGNYVEALEAGASGFIYKDSDSHFLISSIHQAFNGYYPISPSLTKEMMTKFADMKNDKRESLLTDRQVQILKLISEGLSSNDIAEKIYYSPSTTKREIRHIMARLQVNDRAQAVSKAIKMRLI